MMHLTLEAIHPGLGWLFFAFKTGVSFYKTPAVYFITCGLFRGLGRFIFQTLKNPLCGSTHYLQ